MAIVFEGPDCATAWLAVGQHLATVRPVEFNVMVSIADPLRFEPEWFARYDARAISPKGDKIRDVANTLFPLKTSKNSGSGSRDTFYERYKKANKRSRRKRWGTYFGRLISLGGGKVNQLENVIVALRQWKNNPQAALTVHLSSPEMDSLRPIGAPCWHFGEFVCQDRETVSLVAVYRNHDYFNKALGNFVGLSRLLSYVCHETGRNPGNIVCHSVRAYFGTTKSNFEQLLVR